MNADDPLNGGAHWCEEHHRRECVHKSKRSGQRCHANAVRGIDSCRLHAGSRERVLMGKALAERPRVAGHFQPIKVHPAEALLDEVAYWAGLCAWLDRIVAGLQQGEMVWGLQRRRVVSGQDGGEESAEWAAGLNAWVTWATRAHEAKARVARLALEGAEGSMVEFTELQAVKVGAAFERGLRQLDLTDRQWELARQAYPAVLAELAA